MSRPHAALFLLLGLAGCKHAVAPALKDVPPPTLGNSGWTTAFDKESGVSLALPPGWRVGVPKTFDPASMMGSAGAGDVAAAAGPAQEMGTELAKMDADQERKQLAKLREKENIVLHCVDGSKPTPAEEPTRIYVKKLKDAGYATLDDAALAEKQDAHRSMEVTTVDLPVGKAARLKAQGQNRIGDVECHVGYVFLDGPDAYVLRFASTNNPEAILSVEKNVAQSFRLARKR